MAEFLLELLQKEFLALLRAQVGHAKEVLLLFFNNLFELLLTLLHHRGAIVEALVLVLKIALLLIKKVKLPVEIVFLLRQPGLYGLKIFAFRVNLSLEMFPTLV